jgi:hypothetical protein
MGRGAAGLDFMNVRTMAINDEVKIVDWCTLLPCYGLVKVVKLDVKNIWDSLGLLHRGRWLSR